MGIALAVVGFILALIGGIIILIAAFQESVLWGLGMLLVPAVGLVFVFTHWQETKKAFLLEVVGTGLFIAGLMLGGSQTAENMPTPGSGGGRRQIEIPD